MCGSRRSRGVSRQRCSCGKKSSAVGTRSLIACWMPGSASSSDLWARHRNRRYPVSRTRSIRRLSHSTPDPPIAVAGALMSKATSQLPAHSALPEPKLIFGGSEKDDHPLRGLRDHGPYSTILGFPNQLRLAYFAPRTMMSRLDGLARELGGSATPIEAKNYYIRYD